MPEVTALVPTKRDPKRVMIRVDGRTAATLPRVLVDELGVGVGSVWDPDLAGRVAETVGYDKALRDAMRRLDRRAMSTAELRRKLRDREHAPRCIDRAVARLTELGVLDDQAFGRALIRQALARRPAGPRLLRAKLMTKGLDRTLAERLVAESGDQRDDRAGAEALARKRLAAMARLDHATRRRRLWGLLARRGFDPDVIGDVIASLPLGGDGDD